MLNHGPGWAAFVDSDEYAIPDGYRETTFPDSPPKSWEDPFRLRKAEHCMGENCLPGDHPSLTEQLLRAHSLPLFLSEQDTERL